LNPRSLLESLPTIQELCHLFIHDGPGTNLNLRSAKDDLFGELGMIKRLDPQYGAYGYLLNRPAVELILKSRVISYINTPDWPYLWPRKIRFYQSKLVFFSHPKDTSMSIIGQRINAEAKVINQLPNFLRVISGMKLGIGFRELLHKEITLKISRLTLQIFRKMRFLN